MSIEVGGVGGNHGFVIEAQQDELETDHQKDELRPRLECTL